MRLVTCPGDPTSTPVTAPAFHWWAGLQSSLQKQREYEKATTASSTHLPMNRAISWCRLALRSAELPELWKTDAVKEARSCSELWSPISTECGAKSMQLMQICAVWREQKLMRVWKFMNFVKRWNSLTDSSRFTLVGRIHSALKQRDNKQEKAGGSRVKPQELPISSDHVLFLLLVLMKNRVMGGDTSPFQLLWDTNDLLT